MDTIQEHKAGVAAFNGQIGKRIPMRLICIEGNIGAGKSTLTEQLSKFIDAKPMFEPVGANPFLVDYYRDPKRYALPMQFWLMSRRFEMHREAIEHIWKTGQSVVMDRSIYGDWVFARKNYEDGNIDEKGMETYMHHRHVMERYLMVPHTVLYLDARPEVCLARIKERGRGCEKEIPIDYLKGLDDLHAPLLATLGARGSKVVFADWNSFHNVADIAGLIG